MLGDKIKSLRELKRITQTELSEQLDVSPSTVGMWEQNRRTPDAEMLKKISEFFDVSLDYLLGKTTIKNYSEKNQKTVALHSDIDYDDLPESAKEEINNFIEYVKQKYKKNK
ncbi:MAG: helix-turn-helix transcriptional regulator [Clostridiales bacterium]|nr:helix-turn-helix transcriptional regulator [Clostridiales bacterium]